MMNEDDKMQVGRIEQLSDKPDPDVLKALGKRWEGDIVTTIRQQELARLQKIERLARELMKFAKPLTTQLSGAPFWRAWETLERR